MIITYDNIFHYDIRNFYDHILFNGDSSNNTYGFLCIKAVIQQRNIIGTPLM